MNTQVYKRFKWRKDILTLRLSLIGIIYLSGCLNTRDLEQDFVLPTYQNRVAAMLNQECVSCHSKERLEGNYDLSTYLGVLGSGSDEMANAISGDPKSLLLTLIEPGGSTDEFHQPDEAFVLTIKDWVVSNRLAYFHNAIHPPGFLNPADLEFHGEAVKAQAWDMSLCQSCHGENYDGGKIERSCKGCHPQSPEACNTCHGNNENPAPPKDLSNETSTQSIGVGAHQAHLTSEQWHRKITCDSCHHVPEHLTTQGHADGKVDVTFQGIALTRETDPIWNPTTATCQNVYCHGGAFSEEGQGTHPEPIWNLVDGSQTICGSCHNLPPHPQYPEQQCQICHNRVIDRNLTFIRPDLHISGSVEIGDGSNGCHGCHGDATSPAPPRDLNGNTDPGQIGVGAHRIHLNGSAIAAPIACNTCHIKPKGQNDPGHFDTLLPAEVILTGLAAFMNDTFASNRQGDPEWNREERTCNNVYCHGDTLVQGGGSLTQPVWTVYDGTQAACGTCHGIPPANHQPEQTNCSICHSSVTDEAQQIIDVEKHINGILDF